MNTELNMKLGDLVMARPETMRYFERLGIDYCCGGHRSLSEACQVAHQDPAEVLKGLATIDVPAAGVPSLRDWTEAPLVDLIGHIVATHHDYLRDEMPGWNGCSRRCCGPMAKTILNCPSWASSTGP